MSDSQKLSFSITPTFNTFFQKFNGLIFELVEMFDSKDIAVAQPIWL